MQRVRNALYLGTTPLDGSGVRVAVLDSGVDTTHPDLVHAVNLEQSRSFLGLSPDLTDRRGHGTHVAGIIAGSGVASDGAYRGIAPGAELIALKVMGADGRGLSDAVAAAVYEAIELGVDIINYSGGQNGWRKAGQPPWKWSAKENIRDQAFRAAREAGIFCVAAAGNDGPAPGTINSPGLRQSVFCAGALTPDGSAMARRSSRGPVYVDRDLPVNAVVRAVAAPEPAMAPFGPGEKNPDFYDRPAKRLKPDIVVPGGDPLLPKPVHVTLEILGRTAGPISARSRQAEVFPGLVPEDVECLYGSMGGTSQATAVVSGLAALLIQLGERREFDWGDNRATMLGGLFRTSARRPAGCGPEDCGHGGVIWPTCSATLVDCIENEEVRQLVLHGRQLKLID